MTSHKIPRRTFCNNVGISTAGLILGANLAGCSTKKEVVLSSFEIMNEVTKYRKIDAHEHVYLHTGGPEGQIDFADRLGIEKLVVSRPVLTPKGSPHEVRESNDLVLKAMRQFPDRLLGQLTLIPTYGKQSLEEIKRCTDLGMVGIKVYYQVKINDPLFYPIIEKAIDMNLLILMHSFCQLGMAGYRIKYDTGLYPNTSIPEDFVDIAVRYPEAMLQYAHTGGGGDWEYAINMIKNYPNIYVDTSGSNNAAGMIDYALEHLGEDRLFFGTDGSYYQGVGNILASNLNESQKEKIFYKNYNNILRKGGRNVN